MFSELRLIWWSVLHVPLLPVRVQDGRGQEICVPAVDAGQGFAEADGDPVGEAGGETEHVAFAASAGQAAGVQGGDRGRPVDGGHQGGAVADAGPGRDEGAGEVVAVHPAAAVDEQADAGLCREDAAGAGPQGLGEDGHRVPFAAGRADEDHPAIPGNAGMPSWTASALRWSEAVIWASLSSAPARLTLSPSTSPGQPSRSASAMRSCRLARISSRRARWPADGRRSEHLTHACSWMQGVPNARAQVPTDTLRFSKWARKASHSSSLGVRYSSLGRMARRRAMNARCASMASCG